MSRQEPHGNFTVTCGVPEMGPSSRNEDRFDFPDSCVTQPNSWLQTSRSLDTVTSEMEDFQDIFGALLDVPGSAASSVHADISIPSELENSCEPGKSSGTKRKLEQTILRKCYSDVIEASEELKREQNNWPKRTRSAEVHNMSERRRRDRINKRLRTLQELIPNCSKTDRASVLDDAVNYLQALKHQVEIMSASRGAILQASYMSTSGVQSTQVPQLPHFVSMTPELGMASGFGMGLAGMCYSPDLSMLSVPSSGLHPSLGGGVGFPVMSVPRNLVLPQVQMPFIHSQTVPTYADTSARLPNFFTGFPPAFGFSSQEESGSRAIPSIGMNHQQPQMINQENHPSVSSSTMPMIQKTPSSMI